MRAHIALIAVAVWLALATTVLAQSDAQTAPPSDQPADQATPSDQPADQAAPSDQPADQAAPSDQPADQAAPSDQPADQAPVGPMLEASDTARVVCDPATRGFRYVETR